VTTAATSTDAAAVVVVSQLRTHRKSAVEVLRAVDQSGCPVFYAGNAFAFVDQRRDVPGTYLGEAVSVASATILESLSTAGPDPGVPQQAA
ncbi:MAG: hypothetical protein JWP31_2018, partial [Aeromicrobium sp.]|nr:hypothetical protein [Aeromicrobium sp.]